jgi:hypothetical protein
MGMPIEWGVACESKQVFNDGIKDARVQVVSGRFASRLGTRLWRGDGPLAVFLPEGELR